MSTGNSHDDDAIADLNRRITEAEMRSTAATDALAALTRTEADTVETERRFNEEMDTLLSLRQQLWEFRSHVGE